MDRVAPPTIDLLTISGAARRAGVCTDTIRSWVDRGKLPAVRLASGAKWRLFRAADVDAVLDMRRAERESRGPR